MTDRALQFVRHPGNFDALCRNIELNHLQNVRAVNVVCGDSDAKLPRPIDLCPLDAVLREEGTTAIDLLRIDAEGGGLPILRGAAETLKRSPRLKVILEKGQAEELELLEGLGFGLLKTDRRYGWNNCYIVAEKSRRVP